MLKNVEERMNHLKSHAALAEATGDQVRGATARSIFNKVRAASVLQVSVASAFGKSDAALPAADSPGPWNSRSSSEVVQALADPGTRLGHFLTFAGAAAADGRDKNQHKFQNEHYQMELAFFELAKVCVCVRACAHLTHRFAFGSCIDA